MRARPLHEGGDWLRRNGALALAMMVPAIIAAEKHGKMKSVVLSAIGLILIGQLLLGNSQVLIDERGVDA